MRTLTSPGPGCGSGRSPSCSTSAAGPLRSYQAAFMNPSVPSSELEADDLAALLAEPVDAHGDDVAGLQELRRLHPRAHAGRRAGGDDVARIQRHALAHVRHQRRAIEDQGLRVAGLAP